ncbi:MAG: hypothetical protein EXR79_15485 [Myxococcales bacterium]|nr:hypothetical protein [Myxococcales bacterium]
MFRTRAVNRVTCCATTLAVAAAALGACSRERPAPAPIDPGAIVAPTVPPPAPATQVLAPAVPAPEAPSASAVPAAASLASIGTPTGLDAAGLPTPATDAAGLVQALHAAFNAHDFKSVAARYAETVTLETVGVPMPAVHGRTGIEAMWKVTFAGFSDARVAARRVFDFGAVVVVQEVFTGTHDGTYLGKAATRKRAGIEILRVLNVDAGHITRVREYQNLTALLAQIGVLPASGTPQPVPAPPTGPPEVVTGPPAPGVVAAVQRVVAAMMAPQLRGLPGAVSAEFAYHDFVEGRDYLGLEENAKSLLAWRAAFADFAIVAEEQWAAGPWVVTLSVVTAKHSGDLGARLKATGKVVATHSADVAHVADDRQTEGWGYADPAELLIQLGLLPAPVPGP